MRLLMVLLVDPSVGPAVAAELDTSVTVAVAVAVTFTAAALELIDTLGIAELTTMVVELRESVADGSAVAGPVADASVADKAVDDGSAADESVAEAAADVNDGVETTAPEASAKHAGGMFVGMSNEIPVPVGAAASVDTEVPESESVAVEGEEESVADASSVDVGRADTSVADASVVVSVAVGEDDSVAVPFKESVAVELIMTDVSVGLAESVATTEVARSVEDTMELVEEGASGAFADDVIEDTERV